jgi:anti-sigma regulatory factor (Ser/Thr protein kinase)
VRDRFQPESLRYVISSEVSHIRDCVAEILRHRELAETDFQALRVALQELLLNAIIHGNLEISQETMDVTPRSNAWKNQINQRASTQPYCRRTVRLAVHWTIDCVVITISDMGKGFDWRKIPDHTESNDAIQEPKRGISMARMAVDSLRYNDTGNEVSITKRLRPVGS